LHVCLERLGDLVVVTLELVEGAGEFSAVSWESLGSSSLRWMIER
jgi:hypothetical protein